MYMYRSPMLPHYTLTRPLGQVLTFLKIPSHRPPSITGHSPRLGEKICAPPKHTLRNRTLPVLERTLFRKSHAPRTPLSSVKHKNVVPVRAVKSVIRSVSVSTA